MFTTILPIIDKIYGSLMLAGLIILLPKIFYHFYGLFPSKHLPEAQQQHRFAILIPARNESKVIRNLLDSLQQSTYPHHLYDIYVIIEDLADPTAQICQEYANVTCFVRPNLDVKSKGAALDQMLKHLLTTGTAITRGYEAYFIFDADNIVAPDYLTEMNKVYDAGYAVALGYRNATNWNAGWIASGSALTFSMINTFQNKCRSHLMRHVLISGTGYYVAAKVINDLGGWPFQSLTEDAEISYYAAQHDLPGYYHEYATFWDEQPTTLRATFAQRLRWVKGYFWVNHHYHRQMVKKLFTAQQHRLAKWDFAANIIPVVIPLASTIIYILVNLGLGFCGCTAALLRSGLTFAGLVGFFMFYAALLLFGERHHINIKFRHMITTCLMFPIFMGLYLPIVITAICKRNITWQPIIHQNQTKES